MSRFLFLMIFFTCFCFSQEQTTSKTTNKFTLELMAGHHNQAVQLNGSHLASVTSYMASFRVGVQIDKLTYIKTGVDFVNPVSILELSYSTYQIPLLFGTYINFENVNLSNIKLSIEVGPYYRGKRDFNQGVNSFFEFNSTYGIQINPGITLEVSKRLYALVLLRLNFELDDAFVAEDDRMKISGSSLQLGFGYRF